MNRNHALIAGAVLALLCVIGAAALGATLHAGGAAALKTGPGLLNLLLTVGTAAGLLVLLSLQQVKVETKEVERIVEKRVEVPVPASVNTYTGSLACPPRANRCSTEGNSGVPSDLDARQSLDRVFAHLRDKKRFVANADAANKILNAIYGEESDAAVAPTKSLPPASISGISVAPAV